MGCKRHGMGSSGGVRTDSCGEKVTRGVQLVNLHVYIASTHDQVSARSISSIVHPTTMV